jgi:hypothetical protein
VVLATVAVAAIGVLGLGGFTTYRQLVLAPPVDCALAQHVIDTGAALSPNHPAHAEHWARAVGAEVGRIQDGPLRAHIVRYIGYAQPLVAGPEQPLADDARELQDQLVAKIRSRCRDARVAFPSPTGNTLS